MSRYISFPVLSIALLLSAFFAVASVQPAAAADASPTYPNGDECGCKFGF